MAPSVTSQSSRAAARNARVRVISERHRNRAVGRCGHGRRDRELPVADVASRADLVDEREQLEQLGRAPLQTGRRSRRARRQSSSSQRSRPGRTPWIGSPALSRGIRASSSDSVTSGPPPDTRTARAGSPTGTGTGCPSSCPARRTPARRCRRSSTSSRRPRASSTTMFASGTNSALVLPSAEVSVIESKPSVDPRSFAADPNRPRAAATHARPGTVACGSMDPDRARELLAKERTRIEKAMAALESVRPLEGDEQVEPGRPRLRRPLPGRVRRQPVPRTCTGSWQRSSGPRGGSPTAPTACRSRAANRSRTRGSKARPTAERTIEEQDRLGPA